MQRRFFLSLFIIITYFPNLKLFADNYENILSEGLSYSYNLKFNEAESKFNYLIDNFKNDARAHVYRANLYVWQYLSDKRETDLKKFESYSDLTISVAENILIKNPKDADALFSLASIYGYRTLVFLFAKKYVDGIWSAKKCLSITEDLISSHPKYYDAYLWSGLFNFALSQIPGAFKFVLNVAGAHGDFNTGLKQIEIAALKSKFAEVEANYFLSQITSSYLNENQFSADYLLQLVNKYPNNSLFLYSLASEYIKLNRIDSAVALLDRVIELNNQKFQKVLNLTYFLKGDCYFFQNQFNLAKVFYQKFLDSPVDDDFKPTASFRLGLCYELKNQRDEAKKYYRYSINSKGESDDDLFAKRFCEIYLSRRIEPNEAAIFLAENLRQNGKYDYAIASFENVLTRNPNIEIKAKIFYNLGRIYFLRGETYLAKSYFEKAIRITLEEEKSIRQFSKYYLARIFVLHYEKEPARRLLDEILKENSYDYEKTLTIWCEALKNKISEE